LLEPAAIPTLVEPPALYRCIEYDAGGEVHFVFLLLWLFLPSDGFIPPPEKHRQGFFSFFPIPSFASPYYS
jgi:hypothetical protein